MINKVPNQRTLSIHKEKADKQHLYTVNNLDALDESARRLTSVGGFKLYMYLAKNQDKYQFALSSQDFCMWAKLGHRAYTTAFKELVDEGYLVPTGKKDDYIFYDKSQKEEKIIDKNTVNINIPEEKVEELNGFIF